MIINNDTLIGDSLLLKNLLKVLKDNPDASAVSPKIYFAPGYEFHKDRYSEKDKGKVIWYAGGEFEWANVTSIHRGIDEVDSGKYDKTEKTGFITGCCIMVPKETLEKFGYFDEGYFAYFEDSEWQQRMLQDNRKLYYCGKSYIYHKVSQSLGVGSPLTDYLLTRNRLYFTVKYAGMRTKFAVLREALRMWLFGRRTQKQAVTDFIKGIKGPGEYVKKSSGKYTYPVRLTIVISVYKTAELARRLLKSIYNDKSGFDKSKDEVIVLDDANDVNLDKVIAHFPGVRYLKNIVNKGFVAGYNRLLEYSRGELILMLNSDIEVKPNSIKSLIDSSKKFNNRAVLAGNLYFPNGNTQDSCFNLPTISNAIKEYFFKQKGKYAMYRPIGNKPVKVEAAVMACFLIPKKVINNIGILNRKLIMYFEDVDYCRRLKKAGVSLYFCPEAVFIHHHGATSKIINKSIISERIIISAKEYHGIFYYTLLTSVLWLGQKVEKLSSLLLRKESDQIKE
jgi:GT2 family glycosyltransferase